MSMPEWAAEGRTATKTETDTDRNVGSMFEPEEAMGELVVRKSLDYGDFVGFMGASRRVSRDYAALKREAEAIGAALGTRAFYRWTVKGDQKEQVIEGLTIRAAYDLAMAWGYNASRVAIVEQTGNRVLFAAAYIDLLTMTFVERPHSATLRSPPRKFKNSDDEKGRWMSMQTSLEASKAVRGAILNGLPQWYKDAAWDAAENEEIKRIGDLRKATAECVDAYKKAGWATPEALEAYIGKPRALWNPAAIVQLRNLFKALKNQEVSLVEAFGEASPIPPTSNGKPAPADSKPAAPTDEEKV